MVAQGHSDKNISQVRNTAAACHLLQRCTSFAFQTPYNTAAALLKSCTPVDWCKIGDARRSAGAAITPADVAEGNELPPGRCNREPGVNDAAPTSGAHGCQLMACQLTPGAAAAAREDADAALGGNEQGGAKASHVEPP